MDLIVEHEGKPYPVAFRSLVQIKDALPTSRAVVTDENLARLYPGFLEGERVVTVAPGEASKGLATYERVVRELAQSGADRKTAIVGFGGGVVGDLAGFVAATYLRGVPFVQIPTTLLAQVDSSVGAKVGIDLPEGKNLLGSFWPPIAVYADLGTLRTLPAREFRNGLAEVWKYAYIMDAPLASALEGLTQPGDPRLEGVVRRCVELKAEVVGEDPFERSGRRAILNFGHTIGHAIEAVTGYGAVLHGEAIAIGMVLEARLGERLGITPPETTALVRRTLGEVGLPTALREGSDPDALLGVMRRDKKATQGRLAFSLVETLGTCKLYHDVPEDAVLGVLQAG
ncbi:MAG: 3-dehydroquinate synthase [Fimbriimonadaceae bacterium]|nr:3-dehydroquinate synthase [Fimbriimonadaceae bacterium]